MRCKAVPGLTVVLLKIHHQSYVFDGAISGRTCVVIYPDAEVHTIGIVSDRWEIVSGS